MLSHKKIWSAIDKIAKESELTPSGLAKKAGLDPTSFNKSKRIGSGGKLRWPSTESLYKILKVLGKDLSYFSSLVEPESISEIKLIGFMQSGMGGFAETPEENEFNNITFPRYFSKDAAAIKVNSYEFEPIYRNGDVLIVNPKDNIIMEDDRIVVKTNDDKLLIKRFFKKEDGHVTVKSIDGEDSINIESKDIDWIARVIWVSQ